MFHTCERERVMPIAENHLDRFPIPQGLPCQISQGLSQLWLSDR